MRHLVLDIALLVGVSGCVAFDGDRGEAGEEATDGDGSVADASPRDAPRSEPGPAGTRPKATIARRYGAAAGDGATDLDGAVEGGWIDAGEDGGTAAGAGADGGTPDAGRDAAPLGPASLTLGTAVADGVTFVAFADGDDIPINSAGQAGVVLDLALRTENMPADLFLTVTATPEGGEPVVVYDPGTVPRHLDCADNLCEVVPFRVGTSALGAPLDVVGLLVTVDVVADDGAGIRATASHTGMLQPP